MIFKRFDVYSDANLGSMEIALAISLILFGVLIIQAYNYYQNFDDRLGLKVLAMAVLTLEVFHTYTIVHTIYYMTVTLAGRPNVGPNSYPLTTGVVLETLITALVQTYFSYRIYRLSNPEYQHQHRPRLIFSLHNVIPFFTLILTLLRFGSGLALAAESYLHVPRQNHTAAFAFTDRFGWLITMAVCVGAVVDVAIALSLCYYLKRIAGASGETSRSTGALIDRVMTYTIETGLITSMASVAVVITFQTIRYTEIWFSIYTILAKLYSNSFFVSLNVRERPDHTPAALSALVFTDNNRRTTEATRFTVSMMPDDPRDSIDSFSPPYPIVSLPEKVLNKPSFAQRGNDCDLEARGF